MHARAVTVTGAVISAATIAMEVMTLLNIDLLISTNWTSRREKRSGLASNTQMRL